MRTSSCRLALAVLAILFALSLPAHAQQVTKGLDIGFPEGGVFSGSDFDNVQLNNGNLHIEIPLLTIPGRGLPVVYKYVYDNRGWYVWEHCNHLGTCSDVVKGEPGNNMGLPISGPFDWQLTQKRLTQSCNPSTNVIALTNVVLREPDGTKHHFLPDPANPPGTNSCGAWGSGTTMYADDGSGWILQNNPTTGALGSPFRKDGMSVSSPATATPLSEDSNGNQLAYNNTTLTYTDTLGRTVTGPLRSYDLVGILSSHPSSFSYYDSSGTQRTVQITYTSVSVQTSQCVFGGGDTCSEYSGTWSMPYQITLPNNQTYTFTYAQGAFGEPTSVTLPTGAQISWNWTGGGNDPGGSRVGSRTVTVGGQSYTWTYTYNDVPPYSVTVHDPLGNETRHTFGTSTSNGSPLETKLENFQGTVASGQLLKTLQTDYTFFGGGGSFSTAAPIRETTTWNQTNQVTKVETDWDSITVTNGTGTLTATWKNPIERREFAFGTGAPGALARRTDYNYLHLTNATYRNVNIANRVTSQIIYDGSSNIQAQTTTAYDGSALTATSSVPNHDYTNFGSTNLVRGNPTTISRWLNPGNTWLNTVNAYDDLGNKLASTDPLQHTTTYSYTDSWANSSCVPSGVNTHGYVTQITNALSQNAQTSYYPCLGQVASTRDQNDINASRVGTAYTFDLLGRLTQKNTPDGGQLAISYNDVAPVSVTSTTKINSGQNLISTVVKDGLGRTTQSKLTSDPQGPVLTDTTYDALGRVATASNSYRSGTDITSSPGTTTYTYDALDRKTTEAYPGNSILTTAYCGSTTLVTDPVGKWRRSTTDALGRLLEVDEPNAPGVSVNANGCPGTGEPIWITSYTYDTTGNLRQIVQNGSRQRNFTYDSLSRLLTAANPESSQITYVYNNDGILTSKTDARNITANYSPSDSPIDALHRVTKVTYSNNDPTTTYSYDQAACLGLSTCDNIGNRTSMTDAAGSESWSYDVADRIHKDQRTTNSITKSATYNLDFAGNVISVVYPTGRTVSYTYDSANRPSTAADGSNGIIYATGFKTSPGGTCLTNVTCYTPQGTFYALSTGQSTSLTNGLNLTHIYNSRLQPQEFKASSSGGSAIDITYSFVDPSTSKNAGHVFSTTNNIDTTRSQTFTYDQLNRITSALTTSTFATSPAHCWGETYQYDGVTNGAWGNLTQIVATTNSAYTGCTQESGFTKAADGNNHVSGLSYDSSGNTTNDGVNTYTWDAESQLKVTAGSTYIYDGNGRRVAKANTAVPPVPYKLYWYGSGGEILAETDGAGNTPNEYVFFGGNRVAMLPAGSTPIYYVEDLLGTSRVTTTNTGVVCYDADFYPYGVERTPYTNSCTQNNYKFEGKERDTETLNDDFGARYYSNRFGRWLSADWSAVPVPVPYANLTNPQTLNLYSMVADDLESFADLDGHCIPWCTAAVGAGVGALGSIIFQKIHDPHADINWKKVGAAAVGGAVAGGTMGLLAAPVVATSLTGSAIVVSTAGAGEVAAAGATAGVLGGVAERAVENNGDVSTAIGTPGQIAADAAVGAVSGSVGRQAGGALPEATGAKGAAKEAARLAAKHPALSGSALAKQTSAAAGVAAGTVATQEAVGEAAGHAATEAAGQAVKPNKDKDKP